MATTKGVGLGDKVIKANTEALESLKKELKSLRTERTKTNNKNPEKSTKGLSRSITNRERRSEQLSGSMSGYTNTAKTVSKVAGMETGTIRMFEDKLSDIISKDENVKSALRKGDSDVVREQMVEALVKQTEKMEFATKQEKENFKLLTADLKENFKTAFDWEKIEEKGSSIFFPLTQKFFAGAEMMRSTIVDKFPITMKFLSADMVEHYRQGIGEVAGMVKREFAPVLAPLDALVGPFGAVMKGGFMLMKTFMSQSTDYEKSSAEYSQKTYEILQSQYEMDRKNNLKQEKPEKQSFFKKFFLPLAAFVIGFFSGLFGELATYTRPFINFLKMFKNNPVIVKITEFFGKMKMIVGKSPLGKVGDMFKSLFGFFGKISDLISKSPVAKFVGSIGNLFGKLLLPVIMVWEAIKAAMGADSIRDKILAASSSLLSTFMEFPIWIANKILGLFGDFQLSFDASMVTDFVNKIANSETLYKWVTEPLLDFFMVTVPGWFESISSALSSAFDGISDFGSYLKNQIIDMLISMLGDAPLIGRYVKGLAQYKTATPEVGGAGVGKQISSSPKNPLSAAQAESQAEQIRLSKESISTQSITHREIEKGNKMQMQSSHNQNNIQVNNNSVSDIPADPENMGVLLQTKSWGMG